MTALRPTPLRLTALFAAALLLAAALWWFVPDPLDHLPAPPGEITVLHEQRMAMGARELRYVTLDAGRAGEARIVVSLPRDIEPGERLPVVMLLGGLARGDDNLAALPPPGRNIVIGYDWPVTVLMPQGMDLVRAAADQYGDALAIPGQVTATLRWARAQGWADGERFSLVGFSFGALAAPAAQRLAAREGIGIGWTVLGYGGAPIAEIVRTHPLVSPRWVQAPLGLAAAVLLRPIEPSHHLPRLEGRFLVLEGEDDELIPAAARARMTALTPEPMTHIAFDGHHMGVGRHQQALLAEITETTLTWLREQGAVE
jgi:hypothetical protein